MKKLATVAVAVVMTAVSGFSVAGDLEKAKAEMLTKSISGYKWSSEKTSKNYNGYVSNTPAGSSFKWAKQEQFRDANLTSKSNIEMQTAGTSKVQGFKWGIKSSAEQQGFKWGIK